MAEQNTSPWTLTSHPSEVAACRGRARFAVTASTWSDPELAALVAPPVTVQAFGVEKPRRDLGRHRAMDRATGTVFAPFIVSHPLPEAAQPIPEAARPLPEAAQRMPELPTWRDLAGALAPA
jgi:hypothetical protein